MSSTNNLFGAAGVLNGAPPPAYPSGAVIRPHYVTPYASGATLTAGRLYYLPIYLSRIETFAGFKTFNTSTGDNGEVYRVGLYAESASGGPLSLVIDGGEVTLTAASAIRTLVAPFTNTYVGWHYLACHVNSALGLSQVGSLVSLSSAGQVPANHVALGFGEVSPNFNGEAANCFPYVDTTYGALASTAVAPTSSTSFSPDIRLYK